MSCRWNKIVQGTNNWWSWGFFFIHFKLSIMDAKEIYLIIKLKVSSVIQFYLIFEPMDCNMTCFLDHHQLPGLAQTHIYRVGDAIQPSHPLSAPSPLPSVFPSIRVFSNELVRHIKWPKYWSFPISPSNEFSGLISFRIDWFDFLAVQGTRAAWMEWDSGLGK